MGFFYHINFLYGDGKMNIESMEKRNKKYYGENI